MSGMNPWLASIYGTDGADDLEKTAQSHLLQKLAAENDLDLSQLSPEDLQQLLAEVMSEQGDPAAQQHMQAAQAGQQPGVPAQQAPQGQVPGQQRPAQHPAMAQAFAPSAQPQVPQGMPQGAMQQAAGGGDMASLQKEAQAKFEEADLLGRVMAHAYTQELEKIAMTKTAGKMDALKGAAGKASNFAKSNKKAIGAAAGGAAAGFAAGRMSKKASAGPAFLKLAEMHAAEILSSAGFDPATGTDTYAQQQAPEQAQAPVEGQPQQAVGQEGQQEQGADFAQQLDQTALDMLANAGYDVNEILARLQMAQGQGQA